MHVSVRFGWHLSGSFLPAEPILILTPLGKGPLEAEQTPGGVAGAISPSTENQLRWPSGVGWSQFSTLEIRLGPPAPCGGSLWVKFLEHLKLKITVPGLRPASTELRWLTRASLTAGPILNLTLEGPGGVLVKDWSRL